MLRNNGKLETVHFLNWLCHSGEVDLPDLVDWAQRNPSKMGAGTPEEWLAHSLHMRLFNILKTEFGRAFAMEALSYDGFTNETDYVGSVQRKMIAPLLALAVDRVDCDLIARYLLAETSQLTPSLN